ncbi:hypothetical protein AVL59_26335 [Streptomyces griseochromogenes]|uniref:Uncharacterized protein n=1 Tax=Streptomyces griseochromogenes TaxID=68214 RepID=A0A1B1B183_9ACTN|nr:hypothetical protein AVL59_26335 [Streptomyces griseochromogenes]
MDGPGRPAEKTVRGGAHRGRPGGARMRHDKAEAMNRGIHREGGHRITGRQHRCLRGHLTPGCGGDRGAGETGPSVPSAWHRVPAHRIGAWGVRGRQATPGVPQAVERQAPHRSARIAARRA